MLNVIDFVTPFDFDNNIDYDGIIKLISVFLESKVDGIVLLGESSEAYSLSLEEKIELINFIIKFIDDRMKVYVTIHGNCKDIISLDSEIKNLNFDAYIVGDDIKGNEVGMLKYFTYLADKLSHNIVIDDSKMFGFELIRALSYHPNIVGLSVKTKDIYYLIKISILSNDKFFIYVKNDYLILPSICLDVDGIISVLGNAFPNIVANIITLKDIVSFMKYESLILDLESECRTANIKYLMSLKGLVNDKVRLPIASCSKELKRKIEEDLSKL